MVLPSYYVGIEFVAGSYTNVTNDCYRATTLRHAATWDSAPAAGSADFVLDNATKKYSPRNTSGPYYGNLRPGQRVQFTATYTGSTYQLFNGRIKEIAINPHVGGPQVATINCQDEISRLLEAQVSLPLRVNYNPASLFADIMSATGVQSYSADTIAETVPFVWWNQTTGMNALKQLIESGYYWMNVNGDNSVTLHNRYFNVTGAVVASYNAYYDLSYSISNDAVINNLYVGGTPRRIDSSVSTIAWVIPDQVTIPSSSTTNLWLNYVDPVTITQGTPATSLWAMTPGSTHAFFTGTGGTGSDLTTTISVSLQAFAAAAKVTLINSTATDLYINKLQLIGASIREQPATFAITNDSSSQAVYRDHKVTIDNPLIMDFSFAKNYAAFLLAEFKEPVDGVSVSLKNIFPDILSNDLGNLVSLTEDNTAIASPFVILGIEHDVNMGAGAEHTTTYEVEKYTNFNWFQLDVSQLDVDKLAW